MATTSSASSAAMAVTPRLTEGCIARILANKTKMNKTEPAEDKPVVQVLATKRIANRQIRCQLYDGVNAYALCVFKKSPQIDALFDTNQFQRYGVLRLDQFWVSTVGAGDADVLIITDVTVLMVGSTVNKKLEADSEDDLMTNITQVDAYLRNAILEVNVQNHFNPRYQPPRKRRRAKEEVPDVPIDRSQVCSISALNPQNPDFVIRARITSKSSIRTFTQKNGKEGQVFSFDATDQSSEIRVTAFGSECDKYYEFIEKDMVYYISGGNIKGTDRRWCNLKSDYEIILRKNSAIELSGETTTVPEIEYSFVPIDQLMSRAAYSYVDTIGVIHVVESLHKGLSKRTNKEYAKRDITLVDKSLHAVRVSVWNTDAEEFSATVGQVMAVKNATINSFCGKTLSCVQNTVIQIDPDMTEAYALKGWYDRQVETGGLKDLIQLTKARNERSFDKFLFLCEANQHSIPDGETLYYSCRATILSTSRADKHLYKSCERDGCLKKVVEQNGFYFCDKCGHNSVRAEWRLMLGLNVADATGNVWLTAFQEVAEKLLGMNVEQLSDMYDKNPDQYKALVATLDFKTFIFKVGSKYENYYNDMRVKTTCYAVEEVEPIGRSKKLLDNIHKHSNQRSVDNNP